MRARIIFLAILLLLVGCSTKKHGVINCEKNDECPAGLKCDVERGRCVDIYFPGLGTPRGV
jgi:hypothetical protein